ncbi:MAG: SGNH/GDSL hydrolase family protein [Flavobacteriales bacterium]|nr:SGNH/GDSL hydrolase family protein [Flavobacteriales bacterium]
MNFGVSGWTSTNSLINYILNVQSFNPNYVLIHHGWNESKVRNTPKNLFRTDYSHALTYFHEPNIIDKYPLRISLLYRILKNKFSYTPDWMFLGDATTLKNRPQINNQFDDKEELKPFKRNIEIIIQSCLQNNTKVILSTQPFSITEHTNTSKAIEQANIIMRELSKKYKSEITLLDLDDAVTINMNEVFTDLAHMNDIGNFYKGSEFSRIIINDIFGKSIVQSIPPYKIKPISYHMFSIGVFINKQKQIQMQTKANERSISLYKMIKIDAQYTFNQKNKNKPTIETSFEYDFQEYKIRRNPSWMRDIKEKALERKISIDKMIMIDANHILNKK